MPQVPQIPHKQLKTIYNPRTSTGKATMKQKNYILILCQRRKLEVPDNLNTMSAAEAAQMISNMTNA